MTAKKCRGTNKDGSPCDAYALDGSDYCFHHDPDCADERREARSKGGRARHGRHIGPVGQSEPVSLDTAADVTALIKRTIDDTLRLENSLRRARTIGYLSNLFLKALDVADLEQRVLALEHLLDMRKDRR